MSNLHDAAQNTISACMAVKPGESVLVVCDRPQQTIGRALWTAAVDAGADAMLMEILPRANHGQEPPEAVAGAMKNVDVLLCPTSCSLTHTDARRAATAAGVRTATLPGITEDCMTRTLMADYEAIAKRSVQTAKILSAGQRVRLSSPAGTQLEFSIEGRTALADTGLVHNPGDMSNLPAGEAYLAPIEGSAEGRIVFQAAVAGLGKLGEETIEVQVSGGLAEFFSGGAAAARLDALLAPHGEQGRNLAELGIGTNDRAIVTGMILEDEKILGTVHLALGDNQSMGGVVAVPIHLDGLVLEPSLWVDEKQIMRDGELLV